MAILVTRPAPAGEQLVNRLRASGRSAYHAPLITLAAGRDLVHLPAALTALNAGDLLFVLSQHAVHYANDVIDGLGLQWPASLSYYAIGRRSASALYQVAHLPVAAPAGRENSENLLQLAGLQQVAGKQALILRGNGGRALLGETLAARGASVTYCECYQRTVVPYQGEQQSAYWQQVGIDTLVVTSGEMLQQLYQLVPYDYRCGWLLHCQLIVVSERLATLAQQLGWRSIRVADNADNDALLRAIP
ncbi:uroporphyrinogen-III synthase [Serratia microhaemolytica]|uniref:uroporphyrinogen-III synthase n=1 Tax=Serratia microhaemolytica TaxID=2675110 RepID=UPI000FDEDEE6|nr:uroporphyrinogen-III synthase [Serratia microhaemolytica]